MKKLILFTFLIILPFCAISDNNNSSGNDKLPNKPFIINPLPEEAYVHVFNKNKDNFSSADTAFIMFLQNRYKNNKNSADIESESKLIDVLYNNFITNKNLADTNLAFCSFANCVNILDFHQTVADTRTYPNNHILAPFEQNYPFKLYPVSFINFVTLKVSMKPDQATLYKKSVIRNFAKFLLITLAKR